MMLRAVKLLGVVQREMGEWLFWEVVLIAEQEAEVAVIIAEQETEMAVVSMMVIVVDVGVDVVLFVSDFLKFV